VGGWGVGGCACVRVRAHVREAAEGSMHCLGN
jgi:hypothetical protein